MKTLLDVIYYTAAAILTYQIFRAWWHWGILFVKFMFDEPLNKFKSKVEKPRLFFHIITVGFSLIAFFQLKNSDLYLQFLFFVAILFFGVIFQLTWYDIFETRFIPAVKKNLKILQTDFKSELSIEEARNIFGGLVNKGFLIFDDVQDQKLMEKKFVDVFVDGILPESPFFSLQMKNDQITVLYNCFLKRTDKLSREKFSQIFTRKGKPINLNSLKASISRTKSNNLRDKNIIYINDQNVIEYLFQI